MRIEVTREQFEDLTRDLLERTETTTSLVIKQAGLNWPQIDRVLLVGGSGRMPMVGQMLRKVTGKEPDCSLSPDEVVAHGAALYAGMLAGARPRSGQPACQLVNVNSHSLGVVGVHPRTNSRDQRDVDSQEHRLALPCRADFPDGQGRSAERQGGRRRRRERAARGVHRPGRVRRARPAAGIAEEHAGRGGVRLPRQRPHLRLRARAQRPLLAARRDSTRHRPEPGRPRTVAGAIVRHRPAKAEKGTGTFCATTNAASVPAEGPFRQKVPVPFSASIERLDALYRSVGQMAANLPLPEALLRSQRIAATAADNLALAQANLKKAEHARRASSDTSETIRLDALLAQANTELQQAQAQSDFAHLVLGRECVNAGFEPPNAQKFVAEIRNLQP